MTLRTLFAALLLGLCLPLQAATEVIPLNYRTADDVLGVVQSMLGSEGKVSAYGNQLIVNASPTKIGEVRVLLQQLDTRPRRLLITVERAPTATTRTTVAIASMAPSAPAMPRSRSAVAK